MAIKSLNYEGYNNNSYLGNVKYYDGDNEKDVREVIYNGDDVVWEKPYTLTINAGSHTTVDVRRTNSYAGAAVNSSISNGGVIYHKDTLSANISYDFGYTGSSATFSMNGSTTSYTSQSTKDVYGNVTFATTDASPVEVRITLNPGTGTTLTAEKTSGSSNSDGKFYYGDTVRITRDYAEITTAVINGTTTSVYYNAEGYLRSDDITLSKNDLDEITITLTQDGVGSSAITNGITISTTDARCRYDIVNMINDGETPNNIQICNMSGTVIEYPRGRDYLQSGESHSFTTSYTSIMIRPTSGRGFSMILYPWGSDTQRWYDNKYYPGRRILIDRVTSSYRKSANNSWSNSERTVRIPTYESDLTTNHLASSTSYPNPWVKDSRSSVGECGITSNNQTYCEVYLGSRSTIYVYRQGVLFLAAEYRAAESPGFVHPDTPQITYDPGNGSGNSYLP